MASHNLSAAILVLSLLLFSTFSSACDPCMPKPKPSPKAPPVNPFCPRDTLKFGVCSSILGGLVSLVAGSPVSSKCCALLKGMADGEAAACLCTAIKANVLGINVEVPVAISVLVSACQKSIPTGFKCQ